MEVENIMQSEINQTQHQGSMFSLIMRSKSKIRSGEKRERFHENRRDSNDRENGNGERKGMGKGRECRMKLTKLKYKLNI